MLAVTLDKRPAVSRPSAYDVVNQPPGCEGKPTADVRSYSVSYPRLDAR
jgi:hypothetical protein